MTKEKQSKSKKVLNKFSKKALKIKYIIQLFRTIEKILKLKLTYLLRSKAKSP